MKTGNGPFVLLTIAGLIFAVSFLLLVAAGVNPFIAMIWNVLASLDVGYAIIPQNFVSTPLVLFANLLDSFTFALIAVVLAAFFFDFIKQINIRKRFVMSRVSRMKNHIIIVPYNNFAMSLHKELKDAGEKCVIITEKESDAHRIYRQNDLAVVGDPKRVEAFTIAGIGRAKYVIACADEDLQNAMITVTAKSANARAKIISRVNNIESISKLGSAGAFRMIMPEITTGTEIGDEIVKRVMKE
jgi:voltage-gated potassium channel